MADGNGHITRNEFKQFERRVDWQFDNIGEKIDKLVNREDKREEECKELRSTCRTSIDKSIDCKFDKTDKRFKFWGKIVMVILGMMITMIVVFVAYHPSSVGFFTGGGKATIENNINGQ